MSVHQMFFQLLVHYRMKGVQPGGTRMQPVSPVCGINVVVNPYANSLIQGRLDAYPERRGFAQLKELLAEGVNVSLGNDVIMDPWFSLGKADLVDADTIELVRMEVRELVAGSFLERAPIVAASSRTGVGLDQVRSALVDLGHSARPRRAEGTARLPIDRVFTMKGFGTVVTGTLVAGHITLDDELAVRHAADTSLNQIDETWAKSDAAQRACSVLQNSMSERPDWVRASASRIIGRLRPGSAAGSTEGGCGCLKMAASANPKGIA